MATQNQTRSTVNPAVSGAQYRMAQAVLSGAATGTGMSKKAARELVEKTPAKLRSRFMKENPESSAADMYEAFHGEPSQELLEFVETQHFHENLAALGVLIELRVSPITGGKDINICFDGGDELVENPRVKNGLILSQSIGKKAWSFTWNGKYYGPFESVKERDAAASKLQDVVLGPRRTPDQIKAAKERGEKFVAKYRAPVMTNGKKKRGPIGQANRLVGDVTKTVSKPVDAFTGQVGRVGEYLDGLMTNPLDGTKVSPPRFLDVKLSLYEVPPNDNHGPGTYTFPNYAQTKPAHKGSQVLEIYKTTGGRSLVKVRPTTMGLGMGQYLWGWVDTKYIVSSATWKKHHGESPKVLESNPASGGTVPTFLTSNEAGTQIFVTGGDQSLDLAQLKLTGAAAEKELITVGILTHVTYHTRKVFDGKPEEFDYIHKMGEKGGFPPDLIYDRLNKKLLVSGGSYHIERPFFDTSPGLEN